MIVVWCLIFISMIFYGIGEYYSKKYANNPTLIFAVLSVLFFALNAIGYLPALARWNSLSVLGTIWNVGYFLVTIAMGVFVFQEHLTTQQIVGIVFGLISVILLSA